MPRRRRSSEVTIKVLKAWKREHEPRVAPTIGRVPGLVEAREAAFLDWIERVRAVLAKSALDSARPDGRVIPVGRLLAPAERGCAARAVAEGHLDWMPGSGGVVLPGVSFSLREVKTPGHS